MKQVQKAGEEGNEAKDEFGRKYGSGIRVKQKDARSRQTDLPYCEIENLLANLLNKFLVGNVLVLAYGLPIHNWP